MSATRKWWSLQRRPPRLQPVAAGLAGADVNAKSCGQSLAIIPLFSAIFLVTSCVLPTIKSRLVDGHTVWFHTGWLVDYPFQPNCVVVVSQRSTVAKCLNIACTESLLAPDSGIKALEEVLLGLQSLYLCVLPSDPHLRHRRCRSHCKMRTERGASPLESYSTGHGAQRPR